MGSSVGFICATAGSPASLGPLIACYIYTATKSYRIAFELSTMLNVAALLLLFFLEKPHRSDV